MKIAVRGGHTKASTGANAILNELNEDRKVKDAVIKYLKQLGQEVKDVTPSESTSYPAELNYGINQANNWKADLFVSIHFNKAYNNYNGALGSEVCVYKTHNYAKRVVDGLGSLGFKNRGQKVRTNLAELTKTSMTAMIIEVCFVEATKDAELYKKLGVDAIGKKIAESIVNKSVPTPKPPTNNNSDKKETFFRVIVGSYKDRKNAEAQQKKLKEKGFDSFLEAFTK